MVQRLQFRRRHSYATRSNKIAKIKTPGGKLTIHYVEKRAQAALLSHLLRNAPGSERVLAGLMDAIYGEMLRLRAAPPLWCHANPKRWVVTDLEYFPLSGESSRPKATRSNTCGKRGHSDNPAWGSRATTSGPLS